MSDNIFQETAATTATPETTPTPAAIAVPDEAATLIGEGKKYASVEAALKALPHAQNHIYTLESELKDLREKLNKAAKADEVYKAVVEQTQKPQATPVDEATLSTIIEKKLQEQKALEAAQQNMQAFKSAMTAKFGDKAAEVYEAKAKELGIGMGFLNDLVAKSADAGKSLFGLQAKDKALPTSAVGSINTSVLQNTQQPIQTKTVMGGASTSDMISAWRAAKEMVANKT